MKNSELIVVETYAEAEELGIETYGWNKDDILERNCVVDGELMYCIFVDSGSVDYIYFRKY